MAIQTCVEPGDHGHQQPKDYGSYLNFITCYMCVLILVFAVFFRTEMKRTKADSVVRKSSDGERAGGGGSESEKEEDRENVRKMDVEVKKKIAYY